MTAKREDVFFDDIDLGAAPQRTTPAAHLVDDDDLDDIVLTAPKGAPGVALDLPDEDESVTFRKASASAKPESAKVSEWAFPALPAFRAGAIVPLAALAVVALVIAGFFAWSKTPVAEQSQAPAVVETKADPARAQVDSALEKAAAQKQAEAAPVEPVRVEPAQVQVEAAEAVVAAAPAEIVPASAAPKAAPVRPAARPTDEAAQAKRKLNEQLDALLRATQ